VELGAEGAEFTGEEWKQRVVGKGKCFHRRGLPYKLRFLSEEHGLSVSRELQEQVLSLNRARNCLVHRAGVVSAQHDANDSGKLRVFWRKSELIASGPAGERPVTESNPILAGGESLLLRFCSRPQGI